MKTLPFGSYYLFHNLWLTRWHRLHLTNLLACHDCLVLLLASLILFFQVSPVGAARLWDSEGHVSGHQCAVFPLENMAIVSLLLDLQYQINMVSHNFWENIIFKKLNFSNHFQPLCAWNVFLAVTIKSWRVKSGLRSLIGALVTKL